MISAISDGPIFDLDIERPAQHEEGSSARARTEGGCKEPWLRIDAFQKDREASRVDKAVTVWIRQRRDGQQNQRT
jgi:hypothetical protein